MAETWPLTTDGDDDVTPGHIYDCDIDVDEVIAVIRRHLVWPAPIRDRALEER